MNLIGHFHHVFLHIIFKSEYEKENNVEKTGNSPKNPDSSILAGASDESRMVPENSQCLFVNASNYIDKE